jgi:24-hydroxycholesterol 7alpha-hydroxylase
MWASLANAIPLTFWTLSYILSSEDILAEVRTEIASVLATRAKDAKGDVQLTLADLQRVPSVKRCVLEAVRLHSPGAIPRRVMQPLTLHGYVIPEGDLLLLSPYWAHRDVQFFPEPEAFKPDRWKKAELDKNLFLDGFVGFGGGRYQCPGRWFGLMEIHLFIVLLLHSYDIKLNPPATVPKPSPLHLVGTQLPMTPLTVSFSRSH